MGASRAVVMTHVRSSPRASRNCAATSGAGARDVRHMMSSGTAVARILVLLSFWLCRSRCEKSSSRSRSCPLRPIAWPTVISWPVHRWPEITRSPRWACVPARDGRRLGPRADRRAHRTAELPAPFRERIDAGLERADRPIRSALACWCSISTASRSTTTRFGHAAKSNEALRSVAQSIRETIRKRRLLPGALRRRKEFAVIVPQIDGDALIAIAERVAGASNRSPHRPAVRR